MARMPRVVAVDTPHHITQRGNARRTIFETDSDYLAYLSLLRQYSRLHRLRVVGYCLMPNHVHLIATPELEDSMMRTLHQAHGRYSAYLNARQQRTGHLWQGRYYSCPLDERHFWAAMRYTERNPVRAGLSESPEAYRWSSAALHSSDVLEDGFVDLAPVRGRWACGEWSDFIALDADGEAQQIRRNTLTGRPLGSADFISGLERGLGRTLVPQRGGRPRKSTLAEVGDLLK